MVGTFEESLMTARDDILDRIRSANAGVEVIPVERRYRGRADPIPPGGDLLSLLADRLLDYGATVHRCGPDAIAESVRDLLGGAAPVLRAPGIPGEWCPTADADRAELRGHDLDRYAAVV